MRDRERPAPGGMIVTQDPVWADRARYYTGQAKDDALESVHGTIGYNYRMTEVLSKLDKPLDEWRSLLPEEAFDVLFREATEPPHTSPLNHEKRPQASFDGTGEISRTSRTNSSLPVSVVRRLSWITGQTI